MNKFIVTTTINKPTEATLKYCKLANEKNWKLIIVGDTKTPHEEYIRLNKTFGQCVEYLTPEFQTSEYKDISDVIGWKTIQRRNVGFIHANKNGAEIVATVDDDNIPYDNWGDEIYLNKEVEVDLYENTSVNVFDPLSVTNNNTLWHRGYPIEYLNVKNNVLYKGKTKVMPLIQSDLWDGDPDIDAMARLSFKPMVKFDTTKPFASLQISPFNSQNTFIHKLALKHYAVWPYIGRMDDIWGGYYVQKMLGTGSVIYNKATVYQDRNKQDLIRNLENEIIGYRNTLEFIKDTNINAGYISDNTRKFLDLYFAQF
jgi:hypothetical protein